MKKALTKLGDYLMDISKYSLTVIVYANIVTGMTSWAFWVISVSITLLTLAIGFLLVAKNEERNA